MTGYVIETNVGRK